MFQRRTLLAASIAGSIVPVVTSRAQGAWPSKPVRIVVGFPPGGPTDFAARLIAPHLQEAWKQRVAVENRPGQSQIPASEIVAKSEPDGHTLLLGANIHATNTALFSKLPYDTLADFTPIVMIYTSPTVLVTGADQPFRAAKDIVSAAKATPGMKFASTGNGTSSHLAAEMFKLAADFEAEVVAYPGAGAALRDVVAGRAQASFATWAGAFEMVRQGKLRAIAVAGGATLPEIANVPALKAQGFDIADTDPWYSLIGPKGLPDATVSRISGDVQSVLKNPEVVTTVGEQGGIVLGTGPTEFVARIRREITSTAELVRRVGIRVE